MWETVVRQAPSIGGSLELCYWAKSSGHNRLSRLSAEGLKRALISWLLCSMLRVLYLLALIRTTSVTYLISRSLCKVWLETYQGTLLIILSKGYWAVPAGLDSKAISMRKSDVSDLPSFHHFPLAVFRGLAAASGWKGWGYISEFSYRAT